MTFGLMTSSGCCILWAARISHFTAAGGNKTNPVWRRGWQCRASDPSHGGDRGASCLLGRRFWRLLVSLRSRIDADSKEEIASLSVNDVAAKIVDPQRWIEESAELAKQYAYAPPVSLGKNAVYLTREYETNAHNIARSQAALAAARLANLINNALR